MKTVKWGSRFNDYYEIKIFCGSLPPYPTLSISILKSFLKTQNFLTFDFGCLFRIILYYNLLTVFICFLIILFYRENIFAILK